MPSVSDRPRFEFAFLTDQWEWEAPTAAETLEEARTASRRALEALVREEAPDLACVTVVEDGAAIGVWDWVHGQAHWTSLSASGRSEGRGA